MSAAYSTRKRSSCYTENMQPNDGQDNWQQPAASSGVHQLPPVEADEQTPAASGEFSAENNPQTETPPVRPTEKVPGDDGSLIRWQASEYVQQDRPPIWYVGLTIITLALMVVAIFVMKSITFAILIPVMAFALVIYTKRPPAIIDYTLSRKGLHVNDRLYSYDEFRSFSIALHGRAPSFHLVPRKRFQLGQTVGFTEDIGEPIVDMLGARLPMKEESPDLFDRLISRLRM